MAISHPIFAAAPVLRPSRSIIEPSWWEQHYIVLIIILLLSILFAIIRFRRLGNRAPTSPISPLIISKEALQKLQNQKLTPEALAQISHHFHQYLLCRLQSIDALTSKELLDRLKVVPMPDVEIYQAIEHLLRDMEILKFAQDASPGPSTDIALRALKIVDDWEQTEKTERIAVEQNP